MLVLSAILFSDARPHMVASVLISFAKFVIPLTMDHTDPKESVKRSVRVV